MEPQTNTTIADIIKALGLDALPEEERDRMTEQVLTSILEGALLTLTEQLTDDEAEKLEHFVEMHKSFEGIVSHITETHPQFADIIKTESASFATAMKKGDSV